PCKAALWGLLDSDFVADSWRTGRDFATYNAFWQMTSRRQGPISRRIGALEAPAPTVELMGNLRTVAPQRAEFASDFNWPLATLRARLRESFRSFVRRAVQSGARARRGKAGAAFWPGGGKGAGLLVAGEVFLLNCAGDRHGMISYHCLLPVD